MLNLKQLKLLQDNSPTISLSKYTNRDDFFLFFLNHLNEHFIKAGDKLTILEPILEIDKGRSQSTTFSVNGHESGQLFYLVDDYSLEATLFFYNKEHKHKFILFEEQMVEEISLKTYFFWLSALEGICASFRECKKELN